MATSTQSPNFMFAPSVVGPVIACVDGSPHSREVVYAAADFACSCARPLILFHALAHPGDPAEIPDPLAWNLRRQEAHRELGRLRDMLSGLPDAVSVELSDGDWITALGDRVGKAGTLTVIGLPWPHERGLPTGQVARTIADTFVGSVLLVPPGYIPRAGRTWRIAVPIDGSTYAEAALAEATRIARRSGAELLIVHAIPDAGLTDFGPLATSDLELRMQLDRRNEQAAYGFLETTRRRLADQGLVARSLCIKGDTRSALLRVLGEQAPDLVVLSAKGQGGKRCSDLSIGGTVSYLLDHLTCPVMLVRPAAQPSGRAMAFGADEQLA